MTILKENLIIALQSAIEQRQEYEKVSMKFAYGMDSALLTGWKQVLEALQKGETVTIKDN
jgi:hypothetical protein